ncbi:MAG: HD domain-containing protein [Candidatus Enteromonas sp.]
MKKEVPAYLPDVVPSFLEEAFSLKALTRLKHVGMHCGLEYSSFPYFQSVLPYSRYQHSLGCALLAYRFSNDSKIALAAAFHDVATPVFAHVIDFLRGDYEKQDATEAPTSALLRNDEEVLAYLEKHHLRVEDVEDYHRYPIADNDAPKLSCDRLEYSLSNFLNFHVLSLNEVKGLLDDLCLEKNEFGEEEIMFSSLESASKFGEAMLVNADMYTRNEDRFAMEALSRAIAGAIRKGDLNESDLMEDEVIFLKKWLSSPSAHLFKTYQRLYEVTTSPKPGVEPLFSAKIKTKKRYIDPYVKGKGRLSSLSIDFKRKLLEFLQKDFDETLYGYVLEEGI